LLVVEDALRKVVGFSLKLMGRRIVRGLIDRRLAFDFGPDPEAIVVERGLNMQIAL
jgi:hypothetical protein